jgi:hypothetical protein
MSLQPPPDSHALGAAPARPRPASWTSLMWTLFENPTPSPMTVWRQRVVQSGLTGFVGGGVLGAACVPLAHRLRIARSVAQHLFLAVPLSFAALGSLLGSAHAAQSNRHLVESRARPPRSAPEPGDGPS